MSYYHGIFDMAVYNSHHLEAIVDTKLYQQNNYILEDKDLYLSKILAGFFEENFKVKKRNKKRLKIYIRIYKVILKFYKTTRKRIGEKEENDSEILFRDKLTSVVSVC